MLPQIKVLVAQDHTEIPIAVVSRDHKLVLTHEVLTVVQDVVRARIPHEAVITDKLAYQGALCIREYAFPATHTRFLHGTGTFRLIASYEYSQPRQQLHLYATVSVDQDYALVVGHYPRNVRKQDTRVHIPTIDVAVDRAALAYTAAVTHFGRLARRYYHPRDATSVIASLGVNTRCKDYITGALAVAATQRGNTLWTLLTTIACALHNPTTGCVVSSAERDNLEANRLRMALQVFEMTQTDAWRRMEGDGG